MRIISGKLKGREIKEYNIVGTRPTMDRVKESVFASIQNKINNSVFLDLFAGSGSIGFEAVSNNSKFAYFCDSNKECINNINKYINKFNINKNCITLNNDYNKVLTYFKNNNIKFDIIYIDPPYKLNIVNDINKYIVDNDLLVDNGIIICETDDKCIVDYNNLNIIKEKKYSNTYVTILKLNEITK